MKTFDFSKNGGFPLTQDALDFMQQDYQEKYKALAAMGGTGPFIISGMVEASGNVSNGTLFYQNEIIPFVGGAVGATIVIQTYSTTLQYGDGNSYAVKTRKEASFGTGPVQFNYADLKMFQEGFGARPRSGWINAPTIYNGTCQYYFNKLTRTVYVRGTFTHSQALSSGLPDRKFQAELPNEVWPAQPVYFRSVIDVHQTPIVKDAEGSVYTGEPCVLSTSNGIAFTSRALATVGNPTHYYNFSYQL